MLVRYVDVLDWVRGDECAWNWVMSVLGIG